MHLLHNQTAPRPSFILGNATLASPPHTRFGSGSLQTLPNTPTNYGAVTYTIPNLSWGDFTLESFMYGVGTSAPLGNDKPYVSLGPMSMNLSVPFTPNTYYWLSFTVDNSTYPWYKNASNARNVYDSFWSYSCLMRYNGRTYFFVDSGALSGGVPVPTNGAAGSYQFRPTGPGNPGGVASSSTNLGTTLLIGGNSNATTGWSGYIDEVRLSNIARYTSAINAPYTDTYAVPSSAFTVDANTIALINFNGNYNNSV